MTAGLFTTGGKSNYVIDRYLAAATAVMSESFCTVVIKRELSRRAKIYSSGLLRRFPTAQAPGADWKNDTAVCRPGLYLLTGGDWDVAGSEFYLRPCV